ncbi:MAG TPA: FtsX-like permease family protein, partial [Terriglobales bacterium]|nr:FtsX-like permease family protein [Terriglobales bacterium]
AQRLLLLLLDAFALLALALTIAGIYSVTAYAVSQRTQEIGVRMALGARGANVLRLVLGEGMGLAVRGAAIGVVAAILVLRLSAHLIFGLAAPGALLLAAGVALLAVVAAVSSYVPARRAMRLDPLAALRRD